MPTAASSTRSRDVKLLQGDLAEAWREGETDYATVAMRFALVDKTLERASGRVVEGSDTPTEATEIWTFARRRGENGSSRRSSRPERIPRSSEIERRGLPAAAFFVAA